MGQSIVAKKDTFTVWVENRSESPRLERWKKDRSGMHYNDARRRADEIKKSKGLAARVLEDGQEPGDQRSALRAAVVAELASAGIAIQDGKVKKVDFDAFLKSM